MSDTNATQTVVETTPAPAQPGATEAGARTEDDLDTLLAAFDDQGRPSASTTAKPEPKAEPGNTEKSPPAAIADGAIAEVQQFIFRQDMDKTIKSVRGDLDPEHFDDDFVEAWMDAQARRDPRLSNAWRDRRANPKGFAKVVDGLGRTFAKKYGKMPDKGATEDRDAVTAAVRGASTRAPEGKAPDLGKMTEGEFQAWKDQHMR